jgi:hypothetical protein
MGGAAEDLHVVLRDVELFGDLCNQVFTHVLLAKFGGQQGYDFFTVGYALFADGDDAHVTLLDFSAPVRAIGAGG